MFFFRLLLLVALLNGSNAFLSSTTKGPRGALSESSPAPIGIRLTSVPSTTALSATKKKKKVAKKAAAKKAKAKATPVENFKKAELVAAIAERSGLTKKDSDAFLAETLDIIMEEIGSGKKITLPGFGSFTLKDRAERKGRNPQTGEEMIIPASKSPSFTASKTWKDKVNGK